MHASVFRFSENQQSHALSLQLSAPSQNGSCNFSDDRYGLSPAMPVQAHKAAPDFPGLHRPQWCFPVLFSIQIFRKKQTDLIKLCRIKHPADETKCVHLKLRRFYARCLCNFFAVLYCICISGQTGTTTVPDKIDMRQISSVCCSMFLYKIHCKKDVTQLIKNVQSGMSRYSMLYTRNPFLLSSAQKYLLNSLFPRSSPPPWTLIITGSICVSFPFGRYLSRRCALFLSFAYAISVSKITPCGKWYFLSLSTQDFSKSFLCFKNCFSSMLLIFIDW